MDGFVLINKPAGLTSSDIVVNFKKHLKAKFNGAKIKVGHSGTLDPAACGLLVLAVGQATRFLQYIKQSNKVYKFQILFGVQTDTSDLEGKVIGKNDAPVDFSRFSTMLGGFVGEITQVPTKFSAIKINGQRAYKLARSGLAQDIQMPARKIMIYQLVCNKTNDAWVSADFIVTSSPGLYVRTLAEDIAKKLGTIGVVSYLERIASDGFSLEDISADGAAAKSTCISDCATYMEYKKNGEKCTLPYTQIPLQHLSSIWPTVCLTARQIHQLRNGQYVEYERAMNISTNYAAVDETGQFCGMVGVRTHASAVSAESVANEARVAKHDNQDDKEHHCQHNNQHNIQGAVIFPLCMIKNYV